MAICRFESSKKVNYHIILGIPPQQTNKKTQRRLMVLMEKYNVLYAVVFLYSLVNVRSEDAGPIASKLESLALKDIYLEMGGQYWTDSLNWLVGDPCQNNWYGVECSDLGDVVALSLGANNLTGGVPSSIVTLSSLLSLDLSLNHITVLPHTFFMMDHLRSIDLGYNSLSIQLNAFKAFYDLESLTIPWLT
jgi:hypothetical protein